MTEPEDGAGLPSLLASTDVRGLLAPVLSVVEREAGSARSPWVNPASANRANSGAAVEQHHTSSGISVSRNANP